MVFGDLLGGGNIAGPLPVRIAANGQYIGQAPVVVLPNGQLLTLNNPNGQRTTTDEALLSSVATLPANTPGHTIGLLPPPGTHFDQSLADLVSRVPEVTRGAFKITENESPLPTTRFYVTYNYYDELLKNFGGPNVPRIMINQEVLGYEQAFADNRFSIGVRLPYNQLVSPGFYSNTSLGDLTFITKGVIWQDRPSGSVLSGGLVVTAPTGQVPFANTITGQVIHSTLLQPYLGYIWSRGDFFVQGFSSIVIPTDSDDVTFWANDIAVGYYVYRAQGQFLSAIVPVFEAHLNDPLNHRGTQVDPAGFVDNLTLLGGTHFWFRDQTTLGFAVGAPVTGPRPYSLQATVQLNVRF
jgi:hypothetical protein